MQSRSAKILITGGAGYIGSMTAKLLERAGYAVAVFDNLSTGHRRLARFGAFHAGDLLNPADLDRVLAQEKPAAAIHFAACSLVGESVANPYKYYRNNVAGTLNLLEALDRHGVQKLIFSSTAAVYGEPEKTPIDEEHPQRPINPYGRTKLGIEWLLGDGAQARGLSFVALRYFNAAGADPEGDCGEWHEPESHLLPNLLRAAAGQAPEIKIFGTDYPTPDGTCVRDYVHVHDLALAHQLALEYLLQGGAPIAINLGCAQGVSVREMCELAERVTGRKIPLREEGRRAGDPAVLVASRERARSVLHWQPEYDDPRAMIEHAWNFYQRQGFHP